MFMAEPLSENSRQAFAAENPACIGLETDIIRNLCWGCGHVYDETPVGLAVYVRNDPVNRIDPDGRQDWGPVSELLWAAQQGWWEYSDLEHLLSSLPGVNFNSTLFWYSCLFNPLDSMQVVWDAMAISFSYSNPGTISANYGSSGGGNSSGVSSRIVPDRVIGNPQFKERLYDLFAKSSWGNDRRERAAWIVRDGRNYGLVEWPWDATNDTQHWKGKLPDGLVGSVHTHSNAERVPTPSDYDYATLENSHAPVYIMNTWGIWKISYGTQEMTQVADENWWKPYQKP